MPSHKRRTNKWRRLVFVASHSFTIVPQPAATQQSPSKTHSHLKSLYHFLFFFSRHLSVEVKEVDNWKKEKNRRKKLFAAKILKMERAATELRVMNEMERRKNERTGRKTKVLGSWLHEFVSVCLRMQEKKSWIKKWGKTFLYNNKNKN